MEKAFRLLVPLLLLSFVVPLVACAPARPKVIPPQGVRPAEWEAFGVAPGDVQKQGYIPELFGATLVTYTENGGIATVQGDILVHPTDVPPPPSIVAIRGNNLWPRAIVPFELAPGFANTANLELAMQEWEAKTPIRFVRRAPAVHNDYVRFQNHARDDVGSSDLGRRSGGQSIYIGKTLSSGGIAHEIGHAAGLDHEHNSVERDNFVQIFLDNVEDDAKHNFDKATDFLVLRPYDFVSIMHYTSMSFGKKDAMGNRMTTMARRDGGSMLGRGSTLTADDVRGIEALYGPFAFVSGFGSGYGLGDKSCFLMGPATGSFQSKTGTALFCVASPSWLWSHIGPSDPKISGLSYQCLEVYVPGDSDFSSQKNYLCYPAATPMILTWSDAGPRPNLKCVPPYMRGTGAAWNSANLCYQNATVGVLGELPRNATSGGCLDFDGSNQGIATACGSRRWHMSSVTAGDTTQLALEPADYLQARGPRTCLGTAADVPLSGDRVVAQTCDPAKRSQRWTLGTAGELRNGGPTGLCMLETLGVVKVATCTASTDMKWVLRRRPGPVIPRCDGLTHAEACGDPPVCGTVIDRCGTIFPCGPPCPDPPPDPCPPEGCAPPPPSCRSPNMECCDGTCARVCGVCSP